jgi:HSP20 family protein
MFWSDFGKFVPVADPFEGLHRLQHEMNRIFEGVRVDERVARPAMNLSYNEEQVLAEFDVPGINPAEIEITVEGSVLTVKGERQSGEAERRYLRRERAHGGFERNVELPYAVDANTVQAAYRNGRLSITMPRAAEGKPRKIAINH